MTPRALAIVIAIFLTLPSIAEESASQPENLTATVLCYHMVESPQDDRMQVTRDTFRQHLTYLEMTGYNVIPLRHLYEYIQGERSSIPRNAVVITIDDGWRSAFTEAYPELKARGFPFTLFIYPNIVGKTSYALTWDQIRQMSDDGVDIQSHSLTHGFLTKRHHGSMTEAKYGEWLRREMAESRRVLEKETGKKVRFLAYPYGDYDGRVANAAKRAGYDAALTCDFGPVRRGSDPLRMKRFVIDKRMDFAEFRRYLGARPMMLAEKTPEKVADPGVNVISAKIPNHESLDPRSVGMALLSLGSVVPYQYDAKTGDVRVTVRNSLATKSPWHRAIVWGVDTRTGRRVEATWTFRVGEPERPADQPAQVGAAMIGGGG